MQQQKQKQETMFFEFLKCKNKNQNKFFLGFLALQGKSSKKTKHELSKSKPKRDRISSTNFKNAPKPYKADNSKINKSKRRPKQSQSAQTNSANSLQQKIPKKQEKFFENCNKTLAYGTQENQSKTKQKSQCEAQHKGRSESVSRSSLF